MKRLTPCPSCARHVKSSDANCPFCGAQVLSPPARGSTRTAAFALQASLLVGVVGCGADGAAEQETDAEAPSDSAVAAADSAGGIGAGSNSAGSIIVLDDAVGADAGADPSESDVGEINVVPIYGGVFPDPLRRARV